MADETTITTDAPAAESPGEFTITLVDEANPTIDGRNFEPGKVDWREPPLSLMYLTKNVGAGEGHKESKVGASIQEIWREGSKIKGRGSFLSTPEGQELRTLIKEGALNGVSADVGGAILEQELADDGSSLSRIVQGKIMGATVLPFPAFDDTRIAVVASAVPDHPPVDWFTNPGLKEPTPLTITKDGRVFGHAATWGTCHIGRPGSCLTPPRSTSNYAYFKTGSVLTADGDSVHTGPITLGTGHAALQLNSRATAEHYDHTGTGVADVTTGEDEFGIWVAGAIRPGVTDERLRELRGSALSGDWRSIAGNLELVALLAVNTPGFPVPRTRASFADESDALALVAAGVISDDPTREDLAMKTDAEKSDADLKKDPRHSHNDPKSKENVSDETPDNTPDDQDSEPVSEETAADKRKKVKEFADEEKTLSETDIAELNARLDKLENAVLSLAAGRLETFAADLPVVAAAKDEEDDEVTEDGE